MERERRGHHLEKRDALVVSVALFSAFAGAFIGLSRSWVGCIAATVLLFGMLINEFRHSLTTHWLWTGLSIAAVIHALICLTLVRVLFESHAKVLLSVW